MHLTTLKCNGYIAFFKIINYQINARPMRMLLLVACLCLFFCGAGYSQCSNSIKLKRVAVDAHGGKGQIEVSAHSSDQYSCTLFKETGSGAVKVEEKSGSGNSTISFDNLDTNVSYLVLFEFLSEENKLCRKLQKSGITFEGK